MLFVQHVRVLPFLPFLYPTVCHCHNRNCPQNTCPGLFKRSTVVPNTQLTLDFQPSNAHSFMQHLSLPQHLIYLRSNYVLSLPCVLTTYQQLRKHALKSRLLPPIASCVLWLILRIMLLLGMSSSSSVSTSSPSSASTSSKAPAVVYLRPHTSPPRRPTRSPSPLRPW